MEEKLLLLPKKYVPTNLAVGSSSLRNFLTHLSIWVFYVFYESSILLIIDQVYINVWEVVFNFCLYAAIFYTNSLVVLPKFLKTNKYFLLFCNLLLLIALLIPIRYLLYVHVLPHLDDHVLHPFKNHRMFLAQTVWRGGYFAMLSFGYFFANHAIKVEREKRKLAEVKRKHERHLRKMEKELMDMELTSLRNQINPHFLYNTLNFFYAQLYPYSERTAQGILLLSDIMRYGLQEEEVNGKVMLEKEVQHLRNYIEINQLRFSQRLHIRFDVSGSLAYRMIIPLILITFVENCFKHGDLTDPRDPLVIKLEVKEDTLFFYTRNKKQAGAKKPSTGIGQLNIKRRLDLKCKNKYSLETKETEHHYTCKLTLNL